MQAAEEEEEHYGTVAWLLDELTVWLGRDIGWEVADATLHHSQPHGVQAHNPNQSVLPPVSAGASLWSLHTVRPTYCMHAHSSLPHPPGFSYTCMRIWIPTPPYPIHLGSPTHACAYGYLLLPTPSTWVLLHMHAHMDTYSSLPHPPGFSYTCDAHMDAYSSLPHPPGFAPLQHPLCLYLLLKFTTPHACLLLHMHLHTHTYSSESPQNDSATQCPATIRASAPCSCATLGTGLAHRLWAPQTFGGSTASGARARAYRWRLAARRSVVHSRCATCTACSAGREEGYHLTQSLRASYRRRPPPTSPSYASPPTEPLSNRS